MRGIHFTVDLCRFRVLSLKREMGSVGQGQTIYTVKISVHCAKGCEYVNAKCKNNRLYFYL